MGKALTGTFPLPFLAFVHAFALALTLGLACTFPLRSTTRVGKALTGGVVGGKGGGRTWDVLTPNVGVSPLSLKSLHGTIELGTGRATVVNEVTILQTTKTFVCSGRPLAEEWGKQARVREVLADWRGATRRVKGVLGVVVCLSFGGKVVEKVVGCFTRACGNDPVVA